MKRVMVIGQPGAGKSTLARNVGQITGLPVVHVDKIHWMPGWQERPKADKIRMALEAEAQDAWVFEGGLSKTWENRLARADTLIVLAFPFWLRVWRVFKRTVLGYGRSRPDLPPDCPEHFNTEFWTWIWNTRRVNHARILQFAADAPAGKAVHVLRSPRDVRKFLRSVERMQDLTAVAADKSPHHIASQG